MNPSRDNTTRTKARKAALDILFESELRERAAAVTLAERIGRGEPPVRPFTIELITGVGEHAEELDALVAAGLTDRWTLSRMPRVDRNLARLAAFELTHTDTPARVVINEAVDLAADLSTDDSAAFLNAVLDRVSRLVAERLVPEPVAPEPVDAEPVVSEPLVPEPAGAEPESADPVAPEEVPAEPAADQGAPEEEGGAQG